MKKLSGVFTILLLTLFIFTGCGHEHEWIDATCTEPKTCKTCGATEGDPAGHKWKEATCTEPKTCTVCGATEGDLAEHTWEEATCKAPKTCTVCGKTEGEPLEHDWEEATCTKQKTCKVCGAREGKPLGHTWVDATCTEPKTCSRCGSKDGQPLGHDVPGMTCTEGGVCNRCGEEVPAPGHTWIEATCTEPKTCSVCGETEGEPLGHTTQAGKCDRCGMEVYEPYTGSGDDVLSIVSVGDGIYRAHITNNGSRNFIVKVHDASGSTDLLVNDIGAYDGYVILLGSAPYSFEINSSGDWSIQLEKIETSSETTFSGKGDFVTNTFTSSSTTWHITHDGSRNFIVKSYSTDGRDLLVNTIGTYDGKVLFKIPSGSFGMFEINADGNWTIEPVD